MSSSRPLTVVFAPDSFKGSLTSVEAARAMGSQGWRMSMAHNRAILANLVLVALLVVSCAPSATHGTSGWCSRYRSPSRRWAAFSTHSGHRP